MATRRARRPAAPHERTDDGAAATSRAEAQPRGPAVAKWLERDIWLLEVALDLVRGAVPDLIYAWPTVQWAARSSRLPPRSFYVTADGMPDLEIALGAVLAGTLETIEVEVDLSRMGLLGGKHHLVKPRVFLRWVASKGYPIPAELQCLLVNDVLEVVSSASRDATASDEAAVVARVMVGPGTSWKEITKRLYEELVGDKRLAVLIDLTTTPWTVRPRPKGCVHATPSMEAMMLSYAEQAGFPLPPDKSYAAESAAAATKMLARLRAMVDPRGGLFVRPRTHRGQKSAGWTFRLPNERCCVIAPLPRATTNDQTKPGP